MLVLFSRKHVCRVESGGVFIFCSEILGICLVYVEGLSRGLVTSWNENFDPISTNVLHACIVVELRSKALGNVFKLINVYGPCGDKKPYWDGLWDKGTIKG